MSARNYLSARDKKFEYLPSITHKSGGHSSELPVLSASTSRFNRNLSYTYDVQPYIVNNVERAGTPFSDFFSESGTGTPDFRSEESDSSSGSALRRSNAEATRSLSEEWQRIERTLYDEEGEKCMRPQMVEECKQWRELHPQLRIVGRAILLPEKRSGHRPLEYDEVVAVHYSDYSEFSESEERLSQSSSDVTPQNSPRVSICENIAEPRVSWEKLPASEDVHEPKLSREKISIFPMCDERELPDTFCSLLHITPLQVRSPSQRKRQNPSILKSEIASSRWMKNSRPDSSLNCDRNSAKSFVSLDMRNIALSASDRNKIFNSRVLTARHRDIARLEPLCTPELAPNETSRLNGTAMYPYNMRKVSLPPLLLEEEKKKVVVNSAKKFTKTRKTGPKNMYQLDRMRHNK
ncbi:uncharacterized protein LOC126369407 [Pectinophora gossypiella]|nr:uncharacterized protein LOC126369407 [Pectinophora gossypiella]